jgi:hypothetical protein
MFYDSSLASACKGVDVIRRAFLYRSLDARHSTLRNAAEAMLKAQGCNIGSIEPWSNEGHSLVLFDSVWPFLLPNRPSNHRP